MFALKLNVLQQFPEKDMIWQASKAKQSKSFQIT